MKKTFCLLLVAMLAFTTACGATPTPSQTGGDTTPIPGESTADVSTPTPGIDPTPTPEPPKEIIDVSYLADYTIVYPSAYTDYRMQEIYLLRDVIEHITGSAPDIAADTDEAVEKEIIIGSSDRTTDVSSDIAAFESGLDYLIAKIDNKIVIGGNNFYADMRAIYDFINNYLGYDDIEDDYGEPTVKAEGVNIKLYETPSMNILGSNFGVSQFTEQFIISDVADAHFNMLLTTCAEFPYSDDELRDYVKWCARYDVFVIMDWKQTRSQIDIYADCPIVWGHFIQDEPRGEEQYAVCAQRIKDYLEIAKDYGWRPYVNFVGIFNAADANYDNGIMYETYFKDIMDIFSYDVYTQQGTVREHHVLTILETSSAKAKEYGQEFWKYIEAYDINTRNLNTSKLFRWESYMAMCFGVQCIEYFQYGDYGDNPNLTATPGDAMINVDHTKTDAWYDAQRANAEVLKTAELFAQYENVGAFVLGQRFDDPYTELQNEYDFSDVITDFKNDGIYNNPYLVGCFDKKDGDGHMFMVLNMSALTSIDYDDEWAVPIRLKINGQNVTFYRDGEVIQVTQDSDGYYSLEIPNGAGIVVTVD